MTSSNSEMFSSKIELETTRRYTSEDILVRARDSNLLKKLQGDIKMTFNKIHSNHRGITSLGSNTIPFQPRILRIPVLLVAMLTSALIATGAATPAAAQSSPSGSRTFNVDVGYEQVSKGLEAEAFFPDKLTVDVGDQVLFTLRSHEPHTITFNAPQPLPDPFMPQPDQNVAANPVIFFPAPAPGGPPANPQDPVNLVVSFDGTGYVNSGFLQKPGDAFSVSFTKPGTYQVLCLVHPEHMKGTIVVNPAGVMRPSTDANYRAEAQAQINDYLAKAGDILNSIRVPGPVTNRDGTHTYTVFAGLGDTAIGIDFMRYFGGERLMLKAGDAVTFVMEKNGQGVPHTITFLSGGEEPDFVIPQPQASGPPKLIVNPVALMPAPIPPKPYAGSGYYNSGLLLTGSPGPQMYTVTFSKPGTYEYLCVLHDEDGMKGTIVVQQ